MAIYNATQLALLKDPIDLLLKSTAKEWPLSQDVVQRLALFVDSVNSGITSGTIFEAARDNPVSLLIAFVLNTGGYTNAEEEQIASAIALMIIGSAYETPFAEDVITRLAPAAESTGFLTQGGFREAIRDRPVSTMLQWAYHLGSR
jgi:hypothetical protein